MKLVSNTAYEEGYYSVLSNTLEGFHHELIDLGGVSISTHSKGAGRPLLLLHGYPQNHATWGQVAPGFAERFQCVIVDLPGYGDSRFATAKECRENSSKRQVAEILVRLMAKMGFNKFDVLGHDRGARVAYRMALDHTEVIQKVGIIEVIPTGDMWGQFDADMALKAYHWVFLAQPYPLPESLISANPIAYLEWTLRSWTKSNSLKPFSSAALHSYRKQFRNPDCIHAMCEDYRAGVVSDRALDDADKAAGRRIQAPLHFVWSNKGFPALTGDPLAQWSEWTTTLTGTEIDAGHFAQEENPKAVLDAFVPFFTG
ncbi:MAG: alpha/beta hydrolase [Devosiaceae bacterium]|nr:alpha/beta hydrolase [Devosiaceae bacterium]